MRAITPTPTRTSFCVGFTVFGFSLGTKPNVLVGHALVIENMAHHYSGLDEAIELRMVCNAMQCCGLYVKRIGDRVFGYLNGM
jgi:hypothetical protein